MQVYADEPPGTGWMPWISWASTPKGCTNHVLGDVHKAKFLTIAPFEAFRRVEFSTKVAEYVVVVSFYFIYLNKKREVHLLDAVRARAQQDTVAGSSTEPAHRATG